VLSKLSLMFLASLVLSCTGYISDVGGDAPPSNIDPFNPPDGLCDDAGPMLGDIPIRRLSRVEYENTVTDLLYGLRLAGPEIPADSAESGFENASRQLSAPALLVERYELTAAAAAEAAMADAATRDRILGCSAWGTAAEQSACTDTFLSGFGPRAFRRPLTGEERDFFIAFIEDKTALIDYEAAIELAIMVFMQSPSFSYRIELGSDGAVSPFEMASRLSYLLWQSMPDEVLLAAAAADELRTPEQLEAQARRMLDEPRAREAMIDFHRQWLDFDRVIDEPKDAIMFPAWGPELRDSVREESDRFVGSVFDGDGTLRTLFTSRRAWVDGPLADLYGLDPVSEWTEVELPAGERSGILTRADYLAGHAHETNGSPILRGVFIIDRLLCRDLGAPPVDADTSLPEPDPEAGPMTNRMLFEERTSPDVCQGCHAFIDGLGMGFEHYDSLGRFRVEDNTLPVDASGDISGTDVDGTFTDAIELSEMLAESETVTDCVAQNWVRYAVGRRAVGEDACLIERAQTSLRDHDGDVRELLIAIVTSPDFTRGLR